MNVVRYDLHRHSRKSHTLPRTRRRILKREAATHYAQRVSVYQLLLLIEVTTLVGGIDRHRIAEALQQLIETQSATDPRKPEPGCALNTVR